MHDKRPIVLSVAGLDPTGGAGVLADVAAAQSLPVRAAGVATALTVQRPHGEVRYAPLDPVWVDEALAAVLAD